MRRSSDEPQPAERKLCCRWKLLVTTSVALVPNSFFVTTSKALVTASVALYGVVYKAITFWGIVLSLAHRHWRSGCSFAFDNFKMLLVSETCLGPCLAS